MTVRHWVLVMDHALMSSVRSGARYTVLPNAPAAARPLLAQARETREGIVVNRPRPSQTPRDATARVTRRRATHSARRQGRCQPAGVARDTGDGNSAASDLRG